MSDRSSLEFRSNIFPLDTGTQIVRDREFLDSISDPFALEALWKYNATRGSLLNKLQKWQHRKGQHCIYAEQGDYPWGTRLVDGEMRVVCLCENWRCSGIQRCRPGVVIPASSHLEPDESGSEEQLAPLDSDQDERELLAPEDGLAEINVPDGLFEVTSEPVDVVADDVEDENPTGDDNPADEWRIAPLYFPKHYDEQQAVIVEAKPPARLYVTAGPGTGKTHTLIEKLKYMLDVQEINPGSIMVMSFTRAAVQVIRDRLQMAALGNELAGNWQAIDVTTFDKFCTRLLYWTKANEPRWLGRSEIGGMNYDHRINAAAKLFRDHPELVCQCQHLIVDETQDLVGSRARLVLALISSLPKDCGITLLGDRCQSVYDYQVGKAHNSEAFYDSVQEMGGFEPVTLERNYRQNVKLPYSLDSLRRSILERDVPSASSQITEILANLGEPERELRSLGLSSIKEKLDGTLGILTRTNAQAVSISSLLYKHSVPHTLLRAEREAFWSRLLADVFMDYDHVTIDEDGFIYAAECKGLSFEKSIRSWIGLTSLRGAKAEGKRYKVEDLLRAMNEEIVPESLAATKSVTSGITISTIHGSKGREFDHVWLMSDDLMSASSSRNLDEQKVAYVALSRARLGTLLQKSGDRGLKIKQEGDRCYRVSSPKKTVLKRRVRKRLTHIELRNSTDIDQTSLLSTPDLRRLAVSGALEGMEIRLCLPESVSETGAVTYDIETDDGMVLGRTTGRFIECYEDYSEEVVGSPLKYLPEAFDEVYIDKVISCVGKSGTAPKTARVFGDYAIWYGFTLGGFARVDNSQGY